MFSKVYSAGVIGIEGFEVAVECSAWDRVPRFELSGLPDTAVKEAKNRVRSASENSGFLFPSLDIMINLAPADIKKEGSAYDLAIICAIMQCDRIIPSDYDFSDKCFIGELSLSGEVRAVSGVLSMAIAARDAGRREVFVPEETAGEAAVVDGIAVYGVKNLKQLVDHIRGKNSIVPRRFDSREFDLSGRGDGLDFSLPISNPYT